MAKKDTSSSAAGASDETVTDVTDMTAADAAKLVSREVPIIDDKGKPTGKTKQVPVRANEVLSFCDYGDRVVVVTTDGQKLTGEKVTK